MTKKTHDLLVSVRKYADKEGNEKSEWLNVGSVMQSDKGGEFILLNRTFNPAGMPNPDNRPTVLISKFAVKDKTGKAATDTAEAKPTKTLDDEIPF
jgi:hypothetical protein